MKIGEAWVRHLEGGRHSAHSKFSAVYLFTLHSHVDTLGIGAGSIKIQPHTSIACIPVFMSRSSGNNTSSVTTSVT
jgi:hypothetical protein